MGLRIYQIWFLVTDRVEDVIAIFLAGIGYSLCRSVLGGSGIGMPADWMACPGVVSWICQIMVGQKPMS